MSDEQAGNEGDTQDRTVDDPRVADAPDDDTSQVGDDETGAPTGS
jgi:hypothetical protein